MNHKVFLHRPLAPDELLGHAAYDGKVYESRLGPDKYVGWVELDSGRIYEARLGPDKHIGQVELSSGKVYRHKPLAADEYLGRVDADGNYFTHRAFAPDVRVASITPMPSTALAGAAFMLLVLPALEAEAAKHKPEDKPKSD